MRRVLKVVVTLGFTFGASAGRAQDTGIGLQDTRSNAARQDSIARGRDAANELAGLAAENGGVSSAIDSFVATGGKTAERLYDETKSLVGETAKEAGVTDTLMDGYIDSMESGNFSNRNPNNDTLNDAANQVCAKTQALFAGTGSCTDTSKQDQAKITDKNVILLCNPLSVRLAQVANNPKLVYRNECNWGVPDRTIPGGKRGVKTSTFLCNGWTRPSGISTQNGIPHDAAGFAGVRPEPSPVTGRLENYEIYKGARFISPCRPSPDATNPLKGGCFDPGLFFTFGNCDR